MKKISTFLISAGIIIFLFPIIGSIYVKNTQDQLYQTYLRELGESESSLEMITTQAAMEAQENSIKKNTISEAIGKITISSISSELLLLEGSDARQLKYGAGHIKGTALPGQNGNCCIAGHRSYTFGTYFNRLDELKNGDIIEISYDNTNFKYKVYNSFVVLPEDTSVLSGTKTESIVTLITCHPKGSNSNRLIVQGKLL